MVIFNSYVSLYRVVGTVRIPRCFRWTVGLHPGWLAIRLSTHLLSLPLSNWIVTCISVYIYIYYIHVTGFMLFLVSAPLKLSQVGVPWGSVYKGYIYDIIIPLDHPLL